MNMRISFKWLSVLLVLAVALGLVAHRFRETDNAERIAEVGSDWAWEVNSRDRNDPRQPRIEGRGLGMRAGLKRFWTAMLSDDSNSREYQLHWNEEIFSIWSWDHNDLPELAALKKIRALNPKSFEKAVDFLVEGQLNALLKFSEEDFDLEADTVSLLPLLHLEQS